LGRDHRQLYETRFFTGLRPSEEIALTVEDYDPVMGTLRINKARVGRRDKDRTKTGVDRIVEFCPRAIQVLNRQLALRQDYVMAGKLRHELLFFFPDGKRISDPEVTRWRWTESLQRVRVRQRGPYHARHTYVTWLLMTGKNLLWVAEQNGHSVMLRMYAKWLKGSTEADIEAIRQAMNARHDRSASAPQAINALGTGPNRALM
jgi:integrase